MTHNTTQHNTTQHNTTQHNTAQHSTAQHNTTQHNTTQHNTILSRHQHEYNTIQDIMYSSPLVSSPPYYTLFNIQRQVSRLGS
jgi:hypothetical protein